MARGLSAQFRLVGGKVVEWSSLLLVLACYALTLVRMNKLNQETSIKTRLAFIPFIFVVLRVRALSRVKRAEPSPQVPSAIRTIHDYAVGPQRLFLL
jgi:hypothetical protein